jgi:DNA polymerase I-like protein with 3'-5' exonuclease and polymerase domains
MIVTVDAKALEVRAAAYLSQDKLMIQEILDGVDSHENNRVVMGLPSRAIAKIFQFRLLYGGTEYSYAKDPDFAVCKLSVDQWKDKIMSYYDKYRGLAAWHKKIVQDVVVNGFVEIPTGRRYYFSPIEKGGERVWPRTQILNYPVQGFSAELMAMYRVVLFHRLRKKHGIDNIKFISTVHDSVVVDSSEKLWYSVATEMVETFKLLPEWFSTLFGKELNVPFEGEVKYGRNLLELENVK